MDSSDALIARFLALHPKTIDLSLGRIAEYFASQDRLFVDPFFSAVIFLNASGSFSSSMVGIFVSSFRRTIEMLARCWKMLTRKRVREGRL